jgi:hypothetical protein
MRTSIFRIEAAMEGRIASLRAQLGLPPEEPPPPDKATVARNLKTALRTAGARKRGQRKPGQ